MKSLLCQTNGCTVFDSDGHVVYRVDNYDKKCRKKVYLMDLRGRVLVTIRRKRLQFFGCWYGYRWDSSANRENPWFQVKKYSRFICMGSFACQVTVGFEKYQVEKLASKTEFRIVGIDGDVIAEASILLPHTDFNFSLLQRKVLGLNSSDCWVHAGEAKTIIFGNHTGEMMC
ncbi:hypothetical protein OIU77_023021 [Salix suchowensis]|uniref:Uncharacterized protein n=1 Tax=Salix suchowensis TaxID=1278906 RepID=A0ABQ9C465_9ROSI|nr:hypothetical protein OIU77_023021 [Salix suchowensis]